MPSFQDSIFLFILALLLLGPKRLPMLARELGKWVGEFRRASNEFKMQMEEELRLSEQADRQKQIAAMEAAAPVAPALAEPEQSQLPPLELAESSTEPAVDTVAETTPAEPTTPLPIATSGDISLMPPSTGLPTPRSNGNALGGLIDSIPEVAAPAETTQPMSEIEEHAQENALHGD
jgi:sec-independent protein translocase protein TatB